jgi:hypothetical protein
MNERVVSRLGAVWMATAVVSLILPIFLPSFPNSHYFGTNVIEAAMVTTFLLSFPSSLLGLPLILFSQLSLGIDPDAISGKYFMVVAFFLLGLVQWFQIVPWIFRKERQCLNICSTSPKSLDPLKTDFQAVPMREERPVEEFIEKE